MYRWRDTHGSYPDTLAQVAAEGPLPRDPMTGADLLYRREGQGFVLYSVGLNRQDDGGQDVVIGVKNNNADIVWRVQG